MLDMKFWVRVDHPGEHDCWVWGGSVDRNGYGVYRTRGVRFQANRYAWLEMVGAIPDGMILIHACDDRRCVNPHHMEIATRAESLGRVRVKKVRKTHCVRGHSMDDAYVRGSGSRQCRSCTKIHNKKRNLLKRR